MSHSPKDESGAYTRRIIKPKVEDESININIDNTLKDCLVVVRRIVDKLLEETAITGLPSRECVQSTKDCLTMLIEIKKKEKELLDDISEDELRKIVQGK